MKRELGIARCWLACCPIVARRIRNEEKVLESAWKDMRSIKSGCDAK